MKHSLKIKQILGKLESIYDDIDLDSSPDISEPNTNNESEVDHIGFRPEMILTNHLTIW